MTDLQALRTLAKESKQGLRSITATESALTATMLKRLVKAGSADRRKWDKRVVYRVTKAGLEDLAMASRAGAFD